MKIMTLLFAALPLWLGNSGPTNGQVPGVTTQHYSATRFDASEPVSSPLRRLEDSTTGPQLAAESSLGRKEPSRTPDKIPPTVPWIRVPGVHPHGGAPTYEEIPAPVVQREKVDLADLGKVEIRVAEPEGQAPRLSVVASDGKDILVLTFDGTEPWAVDDQGKRIGPNPQVRFKVVSGPKYTKQFIVATAGYPSNGIPWYSAMIIGPIGGKLKAVSPPLVAAGDGGVYVGELGEGRGYGAAVWNHVMVESMHDPKLFDATFYRLQDGQFVRSNSHRTTERYENGKAPIRKFGITFPSIFNNMPGLVD